jgi:uncharacterized protein (DUF433 family)
VSTTIRYPHIEIDPRGIARVGASRYKVVHLAGEHYHYGWSAEELLRQHPDLKPEEVYSSLLYFYDHYQQLVAELAGVAERAEATRTPSPASRSELLRRKKIAEQS